MRQLKIIVDGSTNSKLTDLFSMLEKDYKSAMQNTVAAFDESVQYTANRWKGWAYGKNGLDNIPPYEKPSATLGESIKVTTNGDLNATISSDHPQMGKIVEGQSESTFDMKTKYPYGKKSRVSKKGIPYLIVKFRWGTANKDGERRAHFSNFIPTIEYNTRVKAMSKSEVLKTIHFEPNYSGEMIERQEYNWADRLRQAWDKKAKGLVRMKDSIGSTYFTFRVISAKSPADSWIRKIPKVEPVDIIAALKRDVEPAIEKFIEKGIEKDIQSN